MKILFPIDEIFNDLEYKYIDNSTTKHYETFIKKIYIKILNLLESSVPLSN